MDVLKSTASAVAIVAIMPVLRAYAVSRLRSKDGVDDLVQDTVERAWRSRETFTEGSSLKAWLFAIMRNQMIDGFRKVSKTIEDIDGAAAARLVTLPDQVVQIEFAEMISALERLTPKMRQAMLLNAMGVAHPEVAAILGCPLGTVKSSIRRGRILLIAAGVIDAD